MLSAATKTIVVVLGTTLCLTLAASAQCPVDVVILKGRVENPSAGSKVRVQLLYPKDKPGESGEVTVEKGVFRIPIEFVTSQSSIFTNLPRRCGRKPKTVIITLLDDDRESDQVFLDFAKGFMMTDPSAYTLRSELVLHGPH